MQGAGCDDVVRVPRRKKAFDEEMLVGPEPYQEDLVWADADITDVNTAWKDWSLKAERYLCCRAGRASDAAWCGRGEGLKIRHVALHKYIWTRAPQKTSIQARAWRRIEVVLQQAYTWRCQMEHAGVEADSWILRLRLCRLEQWCVTALSPWAKFVHEFHLLGAWWRMQDIIRNIVYATQPWAYIVWEAIKDHYAKEWAASAMVSAQAWRTWASHTCAANGKALYQWINETKLYLACHAGEACRSVACPSISC
eukprot:111822-Amphidinium_carterae.1